MSRFSLKPDIIEKNNQTQKLLENSQKIQEIESKLNSIDLRLNRPLSEIFLKIDIIENTKIIEQINNAKKNLRQERERLILENNILKNTI